MPISKAAQDAARRAKANRHRRIKAAAEKLARTEPKLMAEDLPTRPLTRKQVLALLGIGHSKLDELIRAGKMPRPTELGPKTLRWQLGEIQAAWDRLRRPASKSANVHSLSVVS